MWIKRLAKVSNKKKRSKRSKLAFESAKRRYVSVHVVLAINLQIKTSLTISFASLPFQVQRELSAHMRQRDKERDAHLHAETIESFTGWCLLYLLNFLLLNSCHIFLALLIDLVKVPSVSWREARKMFKKEHRWELVESLGVISLVS